MRILFEQHQYDAQLLDGILQDIITGVELDFTKKAKVDFVGYFYCAPINDCVFILPKVLLKDEKQKIDGKEVTFDVIAGIKYGDDDTVTPEMIITKEGQKKYLKDDYRKFLYEFSVWIYRCLNMYRKLNPEERSIYYKQLPQEGGGHRHEARTFLDIILSLIRFNRENQNFFMFTIKNQHSGMNKINWTRTISHSACFVQDEAPVYLDMVNKKRNINFDEELLVIFFSILNYLNEQYGFKVPINCNYELITGRRFESYLRSMGAKRLRQIKYKYFSDKALELWNLCYAFFDNTHVLNVSTDQKEYLLSRNFEHVFEAMIDELIGDSNIPKGLKEQDDGKRVDHLYTYKSLTSHDDNSDEEIYYIGDSKYYKSGHKLGKESIAKQYTYARNVIQWNIDLWMNNRSSVYWSTDDDYNNDEDNFKKVRLRKDSKDGNITEGYDVIPNFFLSAFVDDDRIYNDHSNNIHLHKDKDGEHSTYISYQFPNRLFDRDTLILSHYDVNFLYVLYLYARNKSAEKAAWRNDVRKIFRDEIRKVLEREYDFYAMKAHDGEDVAKDFIESHFTQLMGKVYTPYKSNEIYALALAKKAKENNALLDEIGKFFYVTGIKLGDDPTKRLEELKDANRVTHIKHKRGILVGLVRSDEQLQWIKDEGKYNIRNAPSWHRDSRAGAMTLTRDLYLVHEIVLYKLNGTEPEMIGSFQMASEDSIPSVYNYDDMLRLPHDYPYPDRVTDEDRKAREYIMYEIDANSMHELTDADKEMYKKLIMDKVKDDSGRIGKPFVI